MNKKSNDKLVIIISSLIQFTATFISSMIAVSIKQIGIDLNVSIEEINWISILFFTALISISLPMAKIVYKRGIRKCIIISLFVLLLSSTMSMFSTTIEMLIISRTIQGFCVAVLIVSIYMMLMNQVSEENAGKALGIVSSFGYIGMTSAPAISGFLTHYLSWRSSFFVVDILSIFALLLLFNLKLKWKTYDKKIDIIGSLLYFIITFMFIIGLFNLDEPGGFIFISFSIILLIIFVKYEKKKKEPVLNLSLFKIKSFLVGNYAAMITYFITFIATYVLNIHLQLILGFQPFIVGLILLITPIVMIVVSPFAGKLTDKYDARLLSGIAMIILSFIIFMLCFMYYLPFYVLIILLVLQGIGHGLFSPPNNKFVLTLLDKKYLDDTSALLSTSKEFGKTISLAIYSVVCSIFAIELTGFRELILAAQFILFISLILSISSTIALFYSRYKSEDHVEGDVQDFLKSMIRSRK